MHNMTQPGVSLSDSVVLINQRNNLTAVPVFIGYTEKIPSGDAVPSIYEINSIDNYIDLLGTNISIGNYMLYNAVQHYFLCGGESCFVISIGTYDRSLSLWEREALFVTAFSTELFGLIYREQTITLLSVPDLNLLNNPCGINLDFWETIWNSLLTVCQHSKRIFALLDPPENVEDAKNLLTKLEGGGITYPHFGASYWPYLVVDLPRKYNIDTRFITVPPSASVAAMIQFVDEDQGIWKAPANIAIPHVIEPAYSHLYATGIFNNTDISFNLIRAFPIKGIMIWGCRTLGDELAADRRYVQVRRLLTYIENSLSSIVGFAVFSPNNESTWYAVKALVIAWLDDLWTQGGLRGSNASEAYQVFVGLNESMTSTDVSEGKMIIKIFLAVLVPAEFIEVNLYLIINEPSSTAG